jgi:hypothetical protein
MGSHRHRSRADTVFLFRANLERVCARRRGPAFPADPAMVLMLLFAALADGGLRLGRTGLPGHDRRRR